MANEIDQYERAFRMWRELVELALHKKSVTYEELGQRLKLHPRVLRFPLDIIYRYCIEVRLPPITVLVVGKASGLPGTGYTARTTTGKDVKDVLAYAWADLSNPFDYASRGESLKELAKKVLDGPVSASEVYALVKQRGPMQQIFRLALLDAYRGRCAFSGSTLPETLEAAHVVPWAEADEGERFDVRNGILLNAYYHRLFDAHLLIVGTDYRITSGPALDSSALSDFDQQAVSPVLGQQLKLPRHKNYFPGKDYLERRNTSRSTA